MFGSSVLEAAIALIFVYLLLSLMCTALNEGIASLIQKRGKNLFEGIKNLLNDPTFTGLAQQVDCLFSGRRRTAPARACIP